MCVARVQVGAYRLIVFSPRKKSNYSLSSGPRLRTCFWHELLSVAGSSDDAEGNRLRLCFVLVAQKTGALPLLFHEKLSCHAQQVPSDAMWQIMVEARSSATLCTLLYCMRRGFETVWRAVGRPNAERASQLAAPQWQLLLREHNEACEAAVVHAAVLPADKVEGVGGARLSSCSASGESEFSDAFLTALRHLSAFHECVLRDSVRAVLLTELRKPQPVIDISALLELPRTAPPPYVDVTPRRLSVHVEGTTIATPKLTTASIAEVRWPATSLFLRTLLTHRAAYA